MPETHIDRHNPDRNPNFRLRRGVALGALAVTGIFGARAVHGEPIKTAGLYWVTEPTIEAVKDLAEAVSDANDPKGRKIKRHTVKIENAGGIKGAEMYVEQGNFPEVHDPDTIRYVKYLFEAVGKNNVRGAINEIAPDQNPNQAVDAFTTYLPEEDQKMHQVYPSQEITVGVDTETGDIIPQDQLPANSVEEP